ncbi:hypothetical protein PG2093B_0023 [Bifidobacterium pseudolongum subsp. globosum]|uniref:Restriction endonuclease subunit S n=1 Tax=Bifidobacterium pseudolongum subsp. globosum TaxID=1690 RepID=A0A4Q5A4I1_9BIFI|nr:hypothetical protein [Bifidobacterium pseudolongum]RYQ12657.1 hypothetical protein PG2093B_0023 [Bifidobacterium pseudolongum subsp. globosum]
MMSAKNLRDSILQMAVEGKLVEQREEEGTAADLLASIREQRAQLVREKKAKPVKGGESVIWRDGTGHWFERRGKDEAACIDEEIPCDIPDSWCWARMRTVVNVVSARRVHKSDWRTSGVPFYRAREIVRLSDGQPITDNLFIDTALYDKLSQSGVPQPGDLMVTGVGTIGTSYVVRQDDRFYYKDASVLCFENRCGFNSLYLQLLMQSAMVVNQIRSLSAGTTVDTLTIQNASSLLIPVAPIAEQKRIVEKKEELVPYISEYGKAQEQREQFDRELPAKLRKSILQAAVEGKLTEQSDDDEPASVLLAGIREQRAQLVREGKAKPVKGGESIIYRDNAGHWFERRGKSDPVCIDEEIPFNIPDSWSWARLNSLATLTRGSGIKRSEVREEGLPCVRYGELYTTYDTAITSAHSFVMQDVFDAAKKMGPDDLVITLTGENDIDIGRAVINQTDETLAFGGDLLAITDTPMDRVYMLIAFHSPVVGQQRTQAATGNIIVHLGAEKVGRFLIPVPPLAEQHLIVEKVDAVLNRVNELV